MMWDNTVIPVWITGVPVLVSPKERRESGRESETEVAEATWKEEKIDPGNSKAAEQGVTSSRELQRSCRQTKLLRLGGILPCWGASLP